MGKESEHNVWGKRYGIEATQNTKLKAVKETKSHE